MRYGRLGWAAVLFATAASALAADAVVLRGGSRIELKEPPVQKGNNAILTRADGTLLSVPMSEVDWKATAALKSQKPEPAKPAVVAPPSTPAEAVRTGREEKARVRVTDADVGHQAEPLTPSGEKASEMKAYAPRVEVLDYNQQKTGANLVVSGQLTNPGTLPVTNVRLGVTAIDDEGNPLGTAAATIANGTIAGGKAVLFSATLPVGEKNVSSIRFTPQWFAPPPPAPAGAAAAASAAPAANANANGAAATGAAAPAAAAPAASKPPAPAPTPYGQGLLYAAPAASAPSTPPADGKTGYIPGAASPENQPKPPQ